MLSSISEGEEFGPVSEGSSCSDGSGDLAGCWICLEEGSDDDGKPLVRDWMEGYQESLPSDWQGGSCQCCHGLSTQNNTKSKIGINIELKLS